MRNGLLLAVLFWAFFPAHAGQLTLMKPETEVSAQMAKSYGQLPLSFEVNRGQSDKNVRFISRGQGYTLFLTSTEAVLALRKAGPKPGGKNGLRAAAPVKSLPVFDPALCHEAALDGALRVAAGTDRKIHENYPERALSEPDAAGMRGEEQTLALRMHLVGANSNPVVEGLDELPGKVNYLKGKDPARWRQGLSTYAKVRYRAVYPGVDLVYYGRQRQLEYDFIVQPGANPKAIRLDFRGADGVRINAAGNLLLNTKDGELRLQKPVAYQTVAGQKQNVDGHFVLYESGESGKTAQIGFQVAAYDAAQPLVIDPVLVYSTYLGGSGGEAGYGITVDGGGNAFVTGSTNSVDFPIENSKYSNLLGDFDGFVFKLSSDGQTVLYSTYVGGSGNDTGWNIALDGSGNAYVTGGTSSSDFPSVNAKYPNLSGVQNAFVFKLSSDGQTVLYSTYLGGSSYDFGQGITVDSSGSALVTGYTDSVDFPTVNAKYPNLSGVQDAFIFKLSSNGQTVLYSTYLGGSAGDAGLGIALDDAGNAYVTGSTTSVDFPSVNAKYPNLRGTEDAFIFKLSSDGQTVLYSTYLGGSSADSGHGIAVDGSGNAIVTGATESNDFPTVNAKFLNYSGTIDAFVFKLSNDGQIALYSTYFGGSNYDYGLALAINDVGSIYVTGLTQSTDFPTVSAKYPNLLSSMDAFVFNLDSDGQTVLYSTYLGGSKDDDGLGIAVDGSGNAYVTGQTFSSDFPSANAKYPNLLGATDAFVTKINLAVTNTPEQPVCGPPLPETATPAEKSKNLVLLIHGWNSKPSVWASKMQTGIKSYLISKNSDVSQNQSTECDNLNQQCNVCEILETSDAVWDICRMDWHSEADTGLFDPWSAYVNASCVGKKLGDELYDDGYQFIHFIAHSAGAQVADTAATWIKTDAQIHNIEKPIIYTTFLDAFDPRGETSPYGQDSTWAEQYVDSRLTGLKVGGDDYTRITLQNAYNFDVTSLDNAVTDDLGYEAHGWPVTLYDETVSKPEDFGFGFKLSKEFKDNQDYTIWPKGKRCIAVSNTVCSDDPQVIANFDKKIIIGDVLNYIDIATALKSPTGTVSFIASNVLKLLTGSPVWTELPLEIGEPVNFVSFDYTFQRDAEGLLSVFFDGQLVYRADQRLVQLGEVNHSGDVPVGDIGGGAHSLSIRLDAYNGTQSEIDIANVQLGNKQAVDNQPPIANAGADQTVNARSHVALDGHASSDPDNAPSPLSYNWTQTGGPEVVLSGPTSATPSFTPASPGAYTFSLVVNDGAADSAPDTVVVTVNDAAFLTVLTPNGGEVWNEGSKQTITWSSHNLDSKKTMLIYLSIDNGANWKKIASAKNTGSKTWKIPKKRYVSKQALLKICLKQKIPVCDSSDAVFTINQKPVAEAGAKQTVIAGTSVIFNGGASYDPDNGPSPITFHWLQTRGPSIALNGADTTAPSFIPAVAGTYVFGLEVNDGSATSKLDKTKVKVMAAP